MDHAEDHETVSTVSWLADTRELTTITISCLL